MQANVTQKCLLCTRLKNLDPSILIKRHKVKKKMATKFADVSPTVKALSYFDTYYKPVYKDLWSSIRVALLSGQKYGALVNNFSHADDLMKYLSKLGAHDLIIKAKDIVEDESSEDEDESNFLKEKFQKHLPEESTDVTDSIDNSLYVDKELEKDSDLHHFVPVDKTYSEKELRIKEESYKGVFVDSNVNVEVLSNVDISVPEHLKVFVFKPGNVSDFPPPKVNSGGILGYYLLDAASILPVVALDIQPGESVLDLCAAPGGKSLAILQTMMPASLTCNDISMARIQRLREVMKWYYPDKNSSLQITKFNGLEYNTPDFDKVLVDVPCNTDRHVLMDSENNLFSSSRANERLLLAEKQKELLVAGVKSCKPGGSVVYSTCTLSPPQNDGVVQAAIEEIWTETDIDIAIEDISCIANRYKDTFKFFDGCRYGQLVLPSLTSNFGPMYFCRIKRLN